VEENYRANEVEVPKYYDNVRKEVTKDSLELGKTYQLKVQAKPDYKITSVIVNGEEYTPTEEGAFTINFEVKEDENAIYFTNLNEKNKIFSNYKLVYSFDKKNRPKMSINRISDNKKICNLSIN